ncbi:unnamed protein product [Lasius platythorax]|uniref:Uncharacterized protein n=1 Tax=Lasius platythorax TaxID=488582 RepID=A0AAV2P8I7_9HYME
MGPKEAGKRSEHMSSGKAVHTVCMNQCTATAEKYRANEPTTGNAQDTVGEKHRTHRPHGGNRRDNKGNGRKLISNSASVDAM